VLGIAWIYLVLMMREFFAPRWLKRHPVVYMTSHMMILPLIGLYATACDWWVAGIRLPPAGLYWFFAVNYLSGLVIEIGRKTRVPANEETGVETYSALWGSRNAVRVWVIAILLTAVATWRASARIGVDMPMLILVAVLAIACGLVAVRFLRQQTTSSGKLIDVTSGVCTLLMYIALGTAPLVYRLW
jgi:4-hydroxybenzoate polyprenyltransferase